MLSITRQIVPLPAWAVIGLMALFVQPAGCAAGLVPVVNAEEQTPAGSGTSAPFFGKVDGKKYIFKHNHGRNRFYILDMRTGNVEGEWLATRILKKAGFDTPDVRIVRVKGKEGLFAMGEFVPDTWHGAPVIKESTESYPTLPSTEGATPGKDFYRRLANRFDIEQVRRLQVLDIVMGNGDRHDGNFFLLRSGDKRYRLMPIDHNFAFVSHYQKSDYGVDWQNIGWQRNFIKSFDGDGFFGKRRTPAGTVDLILNRNQLYSYTLDGFADRKAYARIVREIRNLLNNEFIDSLIRNLPDEIPAERRNDIRETLRWRRDHVGKALDDYIKARAGKPESMPLGDWLKIYSNSPTAAMERFILRKLIRRDPNSPGKYVVNVEDGYYYLRRAGVSQKDAVGVINMALDAVLQNPNLATSASTAKDSLWQTTDAIESTLPFTQKPRFRRQRAFIERIMGRLRKFSASVRTKAGLSNKNKIRSKEENRRLNKKLQYLDGTYRELETRLSHIRRNGDNLNQVRQVPVIRQQIRALKNFRKEFLDAGYPPRSNTIARLESDLRLKQAELAQIKANIATNPQLRKMLRHELAVDRIARLRITCKSKTEHFINLFRLRFKERLSQFSPKNNLLPLVKQHSSFLAASYLFVLVRLASTKQGRSLGDNIFSEAARALFSKDSILSFIAFSGANITVSSLGGRTASILSSAASRASVSAAKAVFRTGSGIVSMAAFPVGATAAEAVVNYRAVNLDSSFSSSLLSARLSSNPQAQRIAGEMFSESSIQILVQAMDPMRIDYLRILLEGAAFLAAGAATGGSSPYLLPFVCMGAATAVGMQYDRIKSLLFNPDRYQAKLQSRLEDYFNSLPPVGRRDAKAFAGDMVKGMALHRLYLAQFRRGMATAHSALQELLRRGLTHHVMLLDDTLGVQLRARRARNSNWRDLVPLEPAVLRFGFGSDIHPAAIARAKHLARRGIDNPPFSGTINRPKHIEAFVTDMADKVRSALSGIVEHKKPSDDPLLDDCGLSSPLRSLWMGWERAHYALRALVRLRLRQDGRQRKWLATAKADKASENYHKVLEVYDTILDRDVAQALQVRDQLRKSLPEAFDSKALRAGARAAYKSAIAIYDNDYAKANSNDASKSRSEPIDFSGLEAL